MSQKSDNGLSLFVGLSEATRKISYKISCRNVMIPCKYLILNDMDGGDDGARTRDLRRDRFEVWGFHFNDLPVLSMA